MSIKLFLLFTFNTLTLISSQNVITVDTYDKVLTFTLQKVQSAFNNNLIKEVKNIKIENIPDINAANFVPQSCSSNLVRSLGDQVKSFYVFGPNKLSISYSFTLNGKSASFEFSFFDVRAQMKEALENGKKVQNITIKATLRQSDFSLYDVPSEKYDQVQKEIYSAFNKKIGEFKEKIRKAITDYINNYYSTIAPIEFNSNSLFGSVPIKVNLDSFSGFCRDYDKKFETVLCYYSGTVEKDDKMGMEEDWKDEESKFTDIKDSYNIFINYQLFINVFTKIISAKHSMLLKEGSIEPISFDFIVASLTQVFDGITGYDENDKFEISTTIEKFTFGKDNNSGNVYMTHSIKINENEGVVVFQTQSNFTIEIKKVKAATINFCLTNLSVQTETVETQGITIKKDEGKKILEQNINEVFKLGITSSTCLSDKGITLRDIYSYIDEVFSGEKGFYIKGKHLFQ